MSNSAAMVDTPPNKLANKKLAGEATRQLHTHLNKMPWTRAKQNSRRREAGSFCLKHKHYKGYRAVCQGFFGEFGAFSGMERLSFSPRVLTL
ncbi:MAG: hypothetical protein IJ662_01280 [Clostridia bacterium]|nr:hypothetical protein [Clostridia bacterium]